MCDDATMQANDGMCTCSILTRESHSNDVSVRLGPLLSGAMQEARRAGALAGLDAEATSAHRITACATFRTKNVPRVTRKTSYIIACNFFQSHDRTRWVTPDMVALLRDPLVLPPPPPDAGTGPAPVFHKGRLTPKQRPFRVRHVLAGTLGLLPPHLTEDHADAPLLPKALAEAHAWLQEIRKASTPPREVIKPVLDRTEDFGFAWRRELRGQGREAGETYCRGLAKMAKKFGADKQWLVAFQLCAFLLSDPHMEGPTMSRVRMDLWEYIVIAARRAGVERGEMARLEMKRARMRDAMMEHPEPIPPLEWVVVHHTGALGPGRTPCMGQHSNTRIGVEAFVAEAVVHSVAPQEMWVKKLGLEYGAGARGGRVDACGRHCRMHWPVVGPRGWRAMHTENAFWRHVFMVVFWPVIASRRGDLAKQWVYPFQETPEDLGSPDFWARRSGRMEAVLSRVRDMACCKLRSFMETRLARLQAEGVAPALSTRFAAGDVASCVHSAGGRIVAAVLGRVARGWERYLVGLPDLCVWFEAPGRKRAHCDGVGLFHMLEVKGPRDVVSERQMEWYNVLGGRVVSFVRMLNSKKCETLV